MMHYTVTCSPVVKVTLSENEVRIILGLLESETYPVTDAWKNERALLAAFTAIAEQMDRNIQKHGL